MSSDSKFAISETREVLIPEISKTQLVAGDTLVFRFHESMSQSEMAHVGERINILFPSVKYIILDADSELEILHED